MDIMDIPTGHNPSYGKWFLTDVIHAVQKHGLIEKGDRVCVALSGGRDSTTLAFILWYLSRRSCLSFDVCAVHVKTGGYDTSPLKALCGALSIPYLEARLEADLRAHERPPCSVCAALKRGAMARALEGTGVRRVAFGHHADDAAETLLMNVVYGRRIAGFGPKVEMPGEPFVIVRPMIYLAGSLVRRLHGRFGLPVLDHVCPHAGKGARQLMRRALARLEGMEGLDGLSRRVVEALENLSGRPRQGR